MVRSDGLDYRSSAPPPIRHHGHAPWNNWDGRSDAPCDRSAGSTSIPARRGASGGGVAASAEPGWKSGQTLTSRFSLQRHASCGSSKHEYETGAGQSIAAGRGSAGPNLARLLTEKRLAFLESLGRIRRVLRPECDCGSGRQHPGAPRRSRVHDHPGRLRASPRAGNAKRVDRRLGDEGACIPRIERGDLDRRSRGTAALPVWNLVIGGAAGPSPPNAGGSARRRRSRPGPVFGPPGDVLPQPAQVEHPEVRRGNLAWRVYPDGPRLFLGFLDYGQGRRSATEIRVRRGRHLDAIGRSQTRTFSRQLSDAFGRAGRLHFRTLGRQQPLGSSALEHGRVGSRLYGESG